MSPLNSWKRRILLSALVLVFLILGPWILLNSFGYKIDDTFQIVKTGGLFIHSEISNASVFIEDDYVEDNGAIFRNTLVQKLKPNEEYQIVVQKEGHHDWRKIIYVYPGLVSEGRVMMLPLEFEQREVFPFFDKEKQGSLIPVPGFTIVKKTSDGRIIPENNEYIDIITLFEGENPYEIQTPELVNSTSTATTTETDLPDHYVELGIENPDDLDNLIETNDEISWLQNGNIVLYWIDDIGTIPYYYCGGQEERTCSEEIVLDWGDDIKRFAYYPGRNDVWVVLTWAGIYAVEVDPRSERNVQPIYLGQDLDFRLDSSGDLIVEDRGSFIELDL